MSSKCKFHNPDEIYFVTFAVVNWIDLFIRNEYKDILLESWRFYMKNKGMELFAWCIMTSHVHMIIGSEKEKLENIMRDMKKHTSKKLKDAIVDHPQESRREWILELMRRAVNKNSNNEDFQLWQQDNHPIELSTPFMIDRTLDYIHDKPVKAGFVERPEDYLYSSARDYFGGKGLIDITLLDPVLQ